MCFLSFLFVVVMAVLKEINAPASIQENMVVQFYQMIDQRFCTCSHSQRPIEAEWSQPIVTGCIHAHHILHTTECIRLFNKIIEIGLCQHCVNIDIHVHVLICTCMSTFWQVRSWLSFILYSVPHKYEFKPGAH